MTGASTGGTSPTDLESSVHTHICGDGGAVVLRSDTKLPEAMRTWGADRTVRASVLREAFRLRAAGADGSHCVHLQGLTIEGHLDLDYLTTEANVRLLDCHFRDGLSLRNAQLSSLDLSGSLFEDGSGPCVSAENLVLRFDLRMDRAHVLGNAQQVALSLHGAEISGCVFAGGITIRHAHGPAVDATNLVVKGDFHLDRGCVVGRHPGAALTLRGARIGGRMYLTGTVLNNEQGQAIQADRMRATNGLRIRGATVTGASAKYGIVSLVDAAVGGKVDLKQTRIENSAGPALVASRLKVEGDLDLDETRISGTGERPTVNLFNSSVAGTLSVAGAEHRNTGGCVTDAQQAAVDGDVRLDHSTFTSRTDRAAAVNVFSARVGGYMSLSSTRIVNELGTALFAVQLKVAGDLRLDAGFMASGGGNDGVVRLHASRIGGVLDVTASHFEATRGPALSARSMEVLADLRADAFTVTARGSARDPVSPPMIDLRNTSVRGRLAISPRTIEDNRAATRRKLIALDDMVFGVLDPRITVRDWIKVLAEDTPAYTSQPYQHLAGRYRDQGDEREARQILMAQYRDQLKRSDRQGPLLRVWQKLAGVTIGFGHQPWRAVFGLVGIFVMMSLIALWGGGLTGGGCHGVQRIGRAVEASLPLLRMQQLEGCTTGSGTAGLIYILATWVAQVAAWMFATLFIVGLTTAVRRRPS
ncbi:hypothetical protein [Streptomyces sp. VRA16 Mangrove soil]|uniref:hypothetical protein n=1 Tax=Streptomyces sp. VRA16 Mangrove soil TaxID=2817434 RepID=UPI001A9D4A76|nr:hypothetical protein [Streptomyces sp. VRA16 Mangrove soil]MBO1334015.1 hypothetical protein [Streptomyces sp. VRA16 Mangrove soil]